MSILQAEAKNTVVRLLHGERFGLDRDSQGRVAAWIAMAVIAGDAADRDERAISQVDCSFFMSTKGPPPNWRITIGDFDRGDWPAHWVRHPFRINDNGNHDAVPYNAQFTTFVTGRLFAHVSIAPSGTSHLRVQMPLEVEKKMRQIWLPIRDRIEWPAEALATAEADLVAGAGFSRLQEVMREHAHDEGERSHIRANSA
jgi:hypothetical protein